MDPSRKSNKIRDIVRLQQILKKWKKLANANKTNHNGVTASTSITTSSSSSSSSSGGSGGSSRSIKFLKKTLSFTENSLSNDAAVVPKGYLAVCVGKELKRFVIPMEYLGHQAFGVLLREAEEEFGFQQEGVLKIPCEVALFEKILKVIEDKRRDNHLFFLHHHQFGADTDTTMITGCYSSPDSDHQLTPSHHPQLCR